MTFGAQLKKARKAKRLTQKELARIIGAAHNSISNWENDQNKPDPDTIELLCGALNVMPNYFFNHAETDSTIPTYDNIVPLPNMVSLPILGTIACSAPILAAENIEGYCDVPLYMHADFSLHFKGDSMINARIFDGDFVHIRKQSVVENGEIAAVCIENEATLKKVYLFEDHIALEAANPMYQPIVKWNEEMNSVIIIGKAVGFTSLL